MTGQPNWKAIAEDMLILAHVPEADQLSHEEALKLALERDAEAANQLYLSSTQLNLESAVGVAYR